jgi:hypothetical protein
MKRTTKKSAGKGQLAVVERNDHSALLAHFAQCPQLFSPLLALIESGKQSIAAVMNQAGRAMVELMLQLSAGTIAGQKRPGRQDGRCFGMAAKAAKCACWSGGSRCKSRGCAPAEARHVK